MKQEDPHPAPNRSTRTEQSDGVKPRLPHERDESSDSQHSPMHEVIQQAAKDVERGLVDTDRGPVLDDLYEHAVRPDGEATRDRGAADGRPGTPPGATPPREGG